jgi:hypothetical protein
MGGTIDQMKMTHSPTSTTMTIVMADGRRIPRFASQSTAGFEADGKKQRHGDIVRGGMIMSKLRPSELPPLADGRGYGPFTRAVQRLGHVRSFTVVIRYAGPSWTESCIAPVAGGSR